MTFKTRINENINELILVWLCKTKISWKAKLCHMDTGRSIVYIKADDIYKDIAEDVEARFDAFKTRFELDLIMNQKDHHKKEKNK